MMMAYLDLQESGAAGLSFGSRALRQASVAQEAFLEPTEWTIVRLARDDGLSSIREEGRLGRWVRLVFGIERHPPLANPKLEALRRVAVLSWHHGYNVAPSEIGGFYAAGYSPSHYETLLRHIGTQRLTVHGRNRR
jgi:hypothetical protein